MNDKQRQTLQHIIRQLQMVVDGDARIYEFQFDTELDLEQVPGGKAHTVTVPTGVETITLRMVYNKHQLAKLTPKDSEAEAHDG
jgi:hypothetical protein